MLITGVTKLTDEKWLNLFAASYENGGHKGRWLFASRKQTPHVGPDGDAVILVPVLENPGEPARLVMIREFRVPVGTWVIGLPAGLIDPGEDAETTARREIVEETGYEIVSVRKVSAHLYSSSGMSDEAACIAFVEVRGDADCKPSLEASEALEVLLVDHAEACRMLDDAGLKFDIKAWLVLWMFKQLGRIE
ncbi:MAG: NUDIX hydrolase [Gemmataceae bacterium]|nr:NUDIX hydrolase [Gemmataceae bacterium]